ncbi:MAG: EF-hand domain-containing protein [Luteimonas sp.]
MIKSMSVTLGLVLGLACAAPVVAQVAAAPAPDRFDAADTNDDGRVDRAEYDGFFAELVLLYDNDRDGRLSRAEVANARDPSKFDLIDANHDGFITLQEIDAYSVSDFAVLDANGDGAIDRSESTRQP